MPISEVPQQRKSCQPKPRSVNLTMKCDCLARRAILFVTFIIATTILYGLTTRLLFTAPNYDDVSIDPEGGSHYDYGSKVAAAVWKGAGHWIGMTEPSSTNVTVVSSEYAIAKQEHQGQEHSSTESDASDLGATFVATSHGENTSRRQRPWSRRANLRPQHR
ncbi:hypothetical protein E4T44_05891 [Aureobasidium sp. EXF-8845]|nr:hypothetical protein E4T44_05891 [Aureobasidium sp. EXF-8845]KAI4849606.1 hypothetical protein E4T45_05850 [Aureobasidium sp. EXF-8846]